MGTDTDIRRRRYLDMTDRLGERWLDQFDGDERFYSAAYWDLFMALWRAGEPMRRTAALTSMNGIRSPHTAAKYIDLAIERGLLLQRDNPADARSKLVELSPRTRSRLDAFLDRAMDAVVEVAASEPTAEGADIRQGNS